MTTSELHDHIAIGLVGLGLAVAYVVAIVIFVRFRMGEIREQDKP